MSASEIAELEAQLALLKNVQALTPRVTAEDPAMTPRGGGANAVRALRKVGNNENNEENNDSTEQTSSFSDDQQQQKEEYAEGDDDDDDDDDDDLDLQLYAENGYFPAYVSKPTTKSNILMNETSSEHENNTSATDSNVVAPPNWVAKKTPGKFGKIFWANTVTGATHYDTLPPSLELLAEWAAAAEVKKKQGEEEFKQKQLLLIQEAEEVERQWKLQFEKDRLEKARLEKERLAAQAANATKIPAWKRRLLERKLKKEGAQFSEEELAMLAIMNGKSTDGAGAGAGARAGAGASAVPPLPPTEGAAAAAVAAAAAASSGGETTTEFSEDSKENNNGANPKSPAAVPVLKKEQQIAVDTTNNKTAAIAKPLVEKTFIKPAPLTDFEKLFMAKKKKVFFSK